MSTAVKNATLDVQKAVHELLHKHIEKDREREILARRFGLHERKQTLEEIGNHLGITRERVRQIEKQALNKISNFEVSLISDINLAFTESLQSMGGLAPVTELASAYSVADERGQAHVHLLATVSPDLDVITDNDHFHHTVSVRAHRTAEQAHDSLQELIEAIKRLGKPSSIEDIHKAMNTEMDLEHVHALARSAKQVTSLDGKWGLISWPLVNPKSIRDKIYVILRKQGKPMHFSEIASAIKESNFKRRNVTTQAIHNELIKDSRFVLVGRGIYGLSEWGYSKGTVADVIASILREESPLHRDEIVKRVLAQRQVKPTTVILNLQGKPQFQRVTKATYTLAE